MEHEQGGGDPSQERNSGAFEARLLAGGASLDGELRDAEDALRRRHARAAELVHLPLLTARAAANCRLLTMRRRLRHS